MASSYFPTGREDSLRLLKASEGGGNLKEIGEIAFEVVKIRAYLEVIPSTFGGDGA